MTEEMKKCPYCDEEILITAIKCKHCGEWLDGKNHSEVNKSDGSNLPFEYRKFNWGAFGFTWIWGLYNNSYITFWSFASILLAFIPFIGGFAPLGFSIWFGIKGNEWAWNNKKWDSVEHFNAVQINWAKATLIGAITVVYLTFIWLVVIASIAMYAAIFGL